MRLLQRRKEHPTLIIVAFNLAGAVFGMVFGWRSFVQPDQMEMAYILGSALCMQVAQQCITALFGLRAAVDASLSSFLVSAWGVFWGWAIGESIPNSTALLGCALICAPQAMLAR